MLLHIFSSVSNLIGVTPLFVDTIYDASSKGIFQNIWQANLFSPSGIDVSKRGGKVAIAHHMRVDEKKGTITNCSCPHRIICLPINTDRLQKDTERYLICFGRGDNANLLYCNTASHPILLPECSRYARDFNLLNEMFINKLRNEGYQVKIIPPPIG